MNGLSRLSVIFENVLKHRSTIASENTFYSTFKMFLDSKDLKNKNQHSFLSFTVVLNVSHILHKKANSYIPINGFGAPLLAIVV